MFCLIQKNNFGNILRAIKKIKIYYVVSLLLLANNISYSIGDSNAVMGWLSMNTGMNGPVHALTIYSGNIIAGGEFTRAGENYVNNVALWNGSNWQPLGLGVNAKVLALTVYNDGELIAGGEFTNAGGVIAYKVAKWDGVNWSSLNSGMEDENDKVTSLITHSGDLVVGGQFIVDTTDKGGLSAQLNNIAKWNGMSWIPLGSGLNSLVNALTVYNGELIAGGKFTGKVNRWNGNSWSTVGSGMNSTVNALGTFGSFLIAGGEFIGHLSRWDGNNWTNLGGGVEDNVCAIFNYQNDLVVGGDFLYAGLPTDSLYVNRIAKWNGSSWLDLMNGMNNTVRALVAFDTVGLVSGGDFTLAGGDTSNRVAEWNFLETNSISGEAKYPNSLPVTKGKIYAVRLDLYTYEIIKIDSAAIQNDGSYILTKVPPIPVDLIIYADDEEVDYVPTYYPSTIYWESAVTVTPTTNLQDVNITVIPITELDNSKIPGLIGGHVFLDYIPFGYTNTQGLPFKAGSIVYATRGNAFINFSISNRFEEYLITSLPEGQFRVIVNRFGYTNGQVDIILDQSNGYQIDTLDFSLDTVPYTIGIGNISSNVPNDYKLEQNYPNPFNPVTNINFCIPTSKKVTLTIFNVLGQEITKLLSEESLSRGNYSIQFRTSNLPSGVYFYRLETSEFIEAKKMVLIK